jgi:hypothetical protein
MGPVTCLGRGLPIWNGIPFDHAPFFGNDELDGQKITRRQMPDPFPFRVRLDLCFHDLVVIVTAL